MVPGAKGTPADDTDAISDTTPRLSAAERKATVRPTVRAPEGQKAQGVRECARSPLPVATRSARSFEGPCVATPPGKLRLSVGRAPQDRVKRIAFGICVAESSVVEIAPQKFFRDASDDQIAPKLTRAGAKLRTK